MGGTLKGFLHLAHPGEDSSGLQGIFTFYVAVCLLPCQCSVYNTVLLALLHMFCRCAGEWEEEVLGEGGGSLCSTMISMHPVKLTEHAGSSKWLGHTEKDLTFIISYMQVVC